MNMEKEKELSDSDSDSDIEAESEEVRERRKTIRKELSHSGGLTKPETHPTTISFRSPSILEGWEQIEPLEGHKQIISCVKFSHNKLFSSSLDGSLRIWDPQEKHSTVVLQLNSEIFSFIIHCSKEEHQKKKKPEDPHVVLFLATKSPNIQVYKLSSFLGPHPSPQIFLEKEIDGHSASIQCLIEFNGWIFTGSKDTTIRGYSLQSGEKITFFGHSKSVNGLTVDHKNINVPIQGGKFVSCSDDKTVRVWDISTQKCLRVITHNKFIYSVAIIQDIIYFGTAGSSIQTSSGDRGSTSGHLKGHTHPVHVLTEADGYLLSCSTDGCFRIWSKDTPKKTLSDGSVEQEISCACYQKGLFALGSTTGLIYIIKPAIQGQTLHTLSRSQSASRINFARSPRDLRSTSPSRSPRSRADNRSPSIHSTAQISSASPPSPGRGPPDMKRSSLQTVKRGTRSMANAIKKLGVQELLSKIPEWGLHPDLDADPSIQKEKTNQDTTAPTRVVRSSTVGLSQDSDHRLTPLRFSSGFEFVQGRRWSLEDEHVLIDSLSEKYPHLSGNGAYYAVYDGHGGVNTVRYVHQNLHEYLFFDPSFEDDPLKCLDAAIQRTDEDIRINAQNDYKNWRCGTTVGIMLVYKQIMYIANLGDTEIVIGERRTPNVWEPVVMTEKHKPTVESEKQRIESCGGSVVNGRVNKILAVSRSIGDMDLKVPYVSTTEDLVSSKPYLFQIPVALSYEFAILACDGLWDVISYQFAVNIVAQAKGNGHLPLYCSERLVKEGLDYGSMDNITVVVVFFD